MTATRQTFSRTFYELMSSMRFAVSLLTVLAIASVIGTVLKQNEPYTNYVFEFGQFWFEFFRTLGLFDVYHSAWFLVILVFLVFSTSLCIYRNMPLMLKEMRSFREHATENSLRHFAHQAEYEVNAQEVLPKLKAYLQKEGFSWKESETGGGKLLAAKTGSYHRLGYIFTHMAIVAICIGGLIDGNVPLKLEEVLGFKRLETRNIPQSEVPKESRLSPANLSFRGNVTIPEGDSADVVFLDIADGYFVQELPFSIQLKHFKVEHYPTGQPKMFASDIVVTDKATGKSMAETVTVNHPFIYKGVAIYQASFGDGGSQLKLAGWSLLSPESKPFDFNGTVKESSLLSGGGEEYSVEFTDFRPFNVEPLPTKEGETPKGMMGNLAAAVESSANVVGEKQVQNLGPSFQFKLRDAEGRAKEYDNYMSPVQIDGNWYLLSGMRASPSEPFRYLRFPLDAKAEIGTFMNLRAVMFNETLYPEIAKRFADEVITNEGATEAMRPRLVESAEHILKIFSTGGYNALAAFITKAVPKDQQEKAAQTYLRLLERVVYEAYKFSEEQLGHPAPAMDDATAQFVRDSVNAINDSFFYGSPVYLQLTSFEQRQASGLQLTRSPGKNIVYGGSALLVLGVFAMFYIRERRIWLLSNPEGNRLLFAMSANRKTLDFEKEFERRKAEISSIVRG